MKQFLIAQRYAKALSETIEQEAALEDVLASLRDLAETFRANDELHTTLNNPAILSEKRLAILEDVLKAEDAGTEVASIARTLFGRGRINILGDVAEVFAMHVDTRLNRVTAEVITAMALSPEQETHIQSGLATYSGKTVNITTKIDPDIIGGIVVRLDGSVIDGSFRARLAQLTEFLLAEEN